MIPLRCPKFFARGTLKNFDRGSSSRSLHLPQAALALVPTSISLHIRLFNFVQCYLNAERGLYAPLAMQEIDKLI